MTQLESLRIRAENYVTDYSPLSEMKHLKELEMAEKSVSPGGGYFPSFQPDQPGIAADGLQCSGFGAFEESEQLRKLMLDGRTSGSDDVF